jgi:hypothetical protein
MNRIQQLTVIIGVAIMVLMGLMPPWYFSIGYGAYFKGGYGFLFFPPSHNDFAPVINLSRLLIQWAVIALASCGVIFYFKNRQG